MATVVAMTACASDAPPVPSGAPVPSAGPPASGPATVTIASATELALADAARRTGLKTAQLKVMSAQAVTWPDGSLGCPAPGMMYTQALVPGYRVRIEASGQVLDYHAGRGGVPAMCPAERAQEPLGTEALR